MRSYRVVELAEVPRTAAIISAENIREAQKRAKKFGFKGRGYRLVPVKLKVSKQK